MPCSRGLTWEGFVVVVVVALTCFVVNCGDDDVIAAKPPYPATEPRFVLGNITLAFENADADILRRALNADFAFYFCADEVGEELVTGYVIPESWDRSEFLQAAARLIETAGSASLKVPWDTIGAPEPGTGEYEAEAGLAFAVVQDASRSYRAEGSCGFGFLKSSSAKWELVAWRDYTYKTDLNAGKASLGRILALYYE
jgi:hypothetical protein